jgi:hypothetical protein
MLEIEVEQALRISGWRRKPKLLSTGGVRNLRDYIALTQVCQPALSGPESGDRHGGDQGRDQF